jgi:hypothetical protein
VILGEIEAVNISHAVDPVRCTSLDGGPLMFPTTTL